MDITQEYKLFKYQDYGILGSKEHIHLLRNRENGQICVKKVLDYTQKDVLEFRKRNSSVYFPEMYDFYEKDNGVVVIEEYINGISLEEYMMGEPLIEKEAVKIACQICKALLELHHATPMIVYRDLKSENIMITTDGNVKLVDFDISRTYQEGKKRDTVLLGTVEYAAPEQFGYFQTDNRTDIYAFGVVFNYMLTGKFPIDGIYNGKYENLIKKCIEMEPSKRYQSIEAVLEEIGIEKNEKAKYKLTDYLREIPGFRSGIIWKKILSMIGYLFILYFGLTLEFVQENGESYPAMSQWLNRILVIISQLVTIMICGNYRGISESISFYRSRSIVIRMVSYVLTWFLSIFVAIIIGGIIESIFNL